VQCRANGIVRLHQRHRLERRHELVGRLAFITENAMTLSFEIVQPEKAQAIQIYCDDEGLATLKRALERVAELGHLHLLSRPNGGKELSEQTPFGDAAIQEVIITYHGGHYEKE
jgi:hypothetical protein